MLCQKFLLMCMTAIAAAVHIGTRSPSYIPLLDEICFDSSDDLAIVTKKMKRIVVLNGLTRDDWSDEHDDVMFRYLIDTKKNLLVCFIYMGNLYLQFEIPEKPISELFYFIKKATERITTINFSSTVQFGTAKAPFLECLYQMICRIYGPMFLKESNWSDCIKSQLPLHFSKCLEKVFTARNTVMKRNLLYIPKHISRYEIGHIIGSRELVREVEGVSATWMKIMRSSLVAHSSAQDYEYGPIEELELWQKRGVEYSELIEQLQCKEIQFCIAILKASKSSFYHRYNLLYSSIKNGASIAAENVKLLSILKEPCEYFEKEKLENATDHIKRILDLIRIIFRKSSYYNTNEQICNLLRKVSNLLILICQKEMNIDELLGNPDFMDNGMLMERICCCNAWKEIYAFSEKVHSAHSPLNWEIDTVGVFAAVDAFILRCKNLLEVFKYKNKFLIDESVEDQPCKLLRGKRGERVYQLLKSSEETFLLILQDLAKVKEHALNVQAATWSDHFSQFKMKVQNLEMFTAKSLSSSFEDLVLVEEGLEILKSFHKFSEQQVVRRILDRYAVQLYDLFLADLNIVKMEILKRNILKSGIQPMFAGTAYTAAIVFHRLQRAYQAFENADFLPSSDYRNRIMQDYHKVLDAIDELSFGLFLQWNKSLPKDKGGVYTAPISFYNGKVIQYIGNTYRRLSVRLKEHKADLRFGRANTALARFIQNNDGVPHFEKTVFMAFARSNEKSHLDSGSHWRLLIRRILYVTLNARDMIRLIQELSYWEKKQNEIPPFLAVISKKCDDYTKLQKKIIFLVREYNKIINKLSPFELNLLHPVLKHLNDKYMNGFTRITWALPRGMLPFIRDCRYQCLVTAKLVDWFKDSNMAIVNICENISCQNLFEKDIGYPLDFSDFQMLQHNCRESTKLTLLELYGKVRHEVSRILDIVTEDEQEMVFEPSAAEILTDLGNCIQKMISVLSNIRCFYIDSNGCLCCGDGVYSKSEAFNDVEKYVRIIRKGLTELNESLVMYLRIWKPYSHLWITSKSSVLQFYQAGQWTAENFENDIMRFLKSGNDAQKIERYRMILFCILDCQPLKDIAYEFAQEWKNLLGSILSEISHCTLKNASTFLFITSEKFAKEPQSLNELKHCIDYLKSAKKISQRILPTIVPMYKNFCVLKKFDLISDYKTYNKLCNLKGKWDLLEKSFKQQHIKLQKIQAEFERNFITFGDGLGNRVRIGLEYFMETGPFSSDCVCETAFKQIEKFENELLHLQKMESAMQRDSPFFNITLEPLQSVTRCEDVLKDIKEAWSQVQLYMDCVQLWENDQVLGFEVPSKMQEVKELQKKCKQLKSKVDDPKWIVVTDLQSKLKDLEGFFHVIKNLQNNTLQPRHWEEIQEHLHLKFEPSSKEFTFKYLQTLDIKEIFSKVEDISAKASNEYVIEQGIQSITENSKTFDLKMESYNDYYQLMEAEELLAAIEDQQMALGAVKSSKYVTHFAEVVDDLECSLSLLQEVVDLARSFQQRYFYLETIFCGETVKKQLPKETIDFNSVSKKWRDVTIMMNKVKNVWDVSHQASIVSCLLFLNQSLEALQFSLDSYLETKRQAFPRFYFISNDDLLSILGQAQNPFAIQPHLKKCFDNIAKLEPYKSKENDFPLAIGMHSDDGEYVPFEEPVQTKGFIESWLGDVEKAMRHSLLSVLKTCLEEFETVPGLEDDAFSRWIKMTPGQICWMGIQINWTADVTNSIKLVQESGVIAPLKQCRKKWNVMLNRIMNETLGEVTQGEHEKYMAIILTLVHSRDILDMLVDYSCNDVEAFEWLRQLRYYIFKTEEEKGEDKFAIRQTTAEFLYSFEYLGNRHRLVITPLTDRCYLTMTTALHLCQGVCLKGPSGCGKTETVKDLGKALGCYVLVVNCSESLDYKSLGRMLSGLAQIGAWCSFDEFNRINVEVLSVVATRILTIFRALKTKVDIFVFDKSEIPLRHSCGIFITINPIYYKGRSELPYNLVYMFRPLSMIVPDIPDVSEMILHANNFEGAKLLSQKLQAVFSIAANQLSKQFHYDFGLRSVIQVLRCAIHNKRKDEDSSEDEIVFSSLQHVTIPRLHSSDLPIFKGIMADIFGDVRMKVEYPEKLRKAVEETLKASVLQATPETLDKILQFSETKYFHHAVILIGETGSGKSTTWKALQGASCLLANWNENGYLPVQVHAFNPKAVSLRRVFGELDVETGEWHDGILSALVRTACSDQKPIDKWILFDGPADTKWVESMNSLMDDNKILTLINGERIVMTPHVSLVFEVTNLSNCSPATVSRCGVVYHDYDSLGWQPYFESWLEKMPQNAVKAELMILCDKYLKPALQFKRDHAFEFLHVTELNAVISFCRLCETFLPETTAFKSEESENAGLMLTDCFVFCLIWSVGGNASESGRLRIDTFFQDLCSFLPQYGSVYDYYLCPGIGWRAWKNLLSNEENCEKVSRNVFVQTKETLAYEFVTSALLRHGYPVLLVGDIGTGKTLVAKHILQKLDETIFDTLTLHMSVQSTSNSLQSLIEVKLQKKSRGLFVPASGKKLVTFIDDFNVPGIDEFKIQPPLELIRMWIDHGFWYEQTKIAVKNVQNMTLFAAMGPPGGCRHEISPQLQSRFSVLNIVSPQEPELFRIFSTMLRQNYLGMPNNVQELIDIMTQTILNIYKSVASVFLPTPSKSHYIFSLSDISKVIHGLLLSDKNLMNSRESIIRYFCHECLRVFSDRFVDKSDKEEFDMLLIKEMSKSLGNTSNQAYDAPKPAVFAKIFNATRTYEEVKDFELLKTNFSKAMNDYNQEGHEPLNLVFFQSALNHACRIARGIGNPGGNMLLIGAAESGRRSLCELVSFILGYRMFQIESSRSYGVSEFKDDLKSLIQMVGVENKSVVFFLSDIHLSNESFIPYLNDILRSGMIPDLYTAEELRGAIINISFEEGDVGYTYHEIFMNRIRSKLHIVLKLNSSGSKFREYILNYPALINYCTIDWFEKWPVEALEIIAQKYMADVYIGEPVEEKRLALSNVLSKIHQVSATYAESMQAELNKNIIINSANYLDLVRTFESNLNEKTEAMKLEINRLQLGIVKINETEAKVNVMAAELQVAKLEVSKFQKECDEYLLIITEQTKEADINREVVTEQSVDIQKEESRCKLLADAAEQDLNAVLPSLEEARKALESLNKKDIGEIKSYSKPPVLIEMVLEAVMILRESEPTWVEAKRQLSSPFFLRELTEFDKDHIQPHTLEKIAKYMINPDFKPSIIGHVSIAARSLCMWVRAMYSYGRIFRVVLPKRERLLKAQEELRKQQEQLAEAKRKLKELEEKIKKLHKEYKDKKERKEELSREEIRLTKKLKTAAELVDGLRSEREQWSKKVGGLNEKLKFVIGDSILATAFVSYLGAFISTYRERLISMWVSMVTKAQFLCHEMFDAADFLTTENRVLEWNSLGLPSDQYSKESAIIMFRSHKWPLLIDPEGQAVKWITKMEEDEGLDIISFLDPSYVKVLQSSVILGKPVLIQNILTDIDPLIFPILHKDVICSGAQIQFCHEKITCNRNFRLYLVTKLKNPNFPPDIVSRTCVIDFAIKQKGLEEQLLSIAVGIENQKIEQSKKLLVLSIFTSKKRLQELEDDVLRLLNEAQGSLLDDANLVATLQKSKRASLEIESKLESQLKQEKDVDATRETYRACAERGSILYFALVDMSALDPMYLFSLDPYISQFTQSLRSSTPTDIPRLKPHFINEFHTYAVYKFACRTLFEKHKLLFAFHICAKILEQEKNLCIKEYDFFLRGGLVLDRTTQPPNPCPLWLPSHCWDNITSIEQLPKFMDVTIDFDESANQWHDWYRTPEPEKVLLPGKWRNTCNDFQKMLFIRCLRTDRLTACMATFITSRLGKRFLEPPGLDMMSVLGSSNSKTPLLFIISSGVDPVEYVQHFADKSKMQKKYTALSLGQGQATCANELIADATVNGHWVYLANCHLLPSWMPDLEKITEQLSYKKAHSNFRLWLSSMSTPQFPVSVLQRCNKITIETPKGLKPNMRKLYGVVDEENSPRAYEKKESYMKLLFSLSFFHSILNERKKFDHLGWNVMYNFTEADFLMSASILNIYLERYENTPWDAIKKLIVDINYGGHVTDSQDMLILNAYFEDYFSDEVLKLCDFRLSSLDTYIVPDKSDVYYHIKYIDSLPQEDPPEVFGQNANAEITFRIQEAGFVLENLLKMHPVKVTSTRASLEAMVLDMVEDVRTNMPKPIRKPAAVDIYNIPPPYLYLILQEIYRYNGLIALVKQSLTDLVEGIKGIQIMTPAIEDLFQTISENYVPASWLKTYPSVKKLGSWVQDLNLRVKQIHDWVSTGNTPVKIWLSGFTVPKSVLIAALQVFAREREVLLHELKWEFKVSALEEAHINEHPDEGIYVRGLFLEGAGWDNKVGVLIEPEPLHLTMAMPVIHFRPVHDVNTRGQYHCPCYYIPKRTHEGTSTYVMSVDLKSSKPQNYWIKRGTALLMNID